MNLGFYKTDENAVIPSKTIGDVGLDFTSIESYDLYAGERKVFSTGLRPRIDFGYALILEDRSGNAAKKGLHVLAGVIDSSFRGILGVVLFNTSNTTVSIKAGERICQGIIIKDEQVTIKELKSEEELGITNRGQQGFGSTGL